MIRITLFAVALGVLLTGCTSTPTTGPQSETAKKSIELYEAMKKDSQKKLEDMDAKLKEWKEKVDRATGDTKTALEKRYNELKGQRDKFAEQVNEFGKSAGDAWEKLKEGVEKAGANLGDAFKKAADEFNK